MNPSHALGRVFLVLALASIVGCEDFDDPSGVVNSAPASGGSSSREPYLDRLRSFQTQLQYHGPSPQDWTPERPPANTQEVHYQSGGLSLKAWVFRPAGDPTAKHPALVYFHGGFAFGASDLYDCKPFMDAGFVVMCPMLRGENGNPGNYELMLGEVADAEAAVGWIAEQSDVDRDRIFAFGHSVGGGVAALLSLRSGVPVQHSGSSGGLYGPSAFDGWDDIAPFDVSDPREREMRTLIGNIADMKFPHYAYLGRRDAFDEERRLAGQEAPSPNSPLIVTMVPGDHFASLQPAMMQYLAVVKEHAR